MTEVHDSAVGRTLVAIDIAKNSHVVLIERPGKSRRRQLKIQNTRADIERLISELQKSGDPVTVAFEATGNYHRALAWRLIDAGLETRLISTVALARTREAIHSGWDKNDPKDAQVMLHMLKTGLTQHYHDPLVHSLNDIQELSQTHEVVSRAKTEAIHRLQTHYFPLYFPEVDKFRHNSRAEWFFEFLERFPVPAAIVALRKEEFVTAAWELVGRKVSKRLVLQDIYDTAASSVALPVPVDASAVEMYRLVVAHVRQLIQQRDQIEALAEKQLAENADYQRLKQLPGIGPIIALTILAEAGHTRQFLRFCGFNLATHQSGSYRGQSKLSKQGNARLRRAFWMAGQIAVRQRANDFRDKFERYIAKNQQDRDLRRKALTAVAAKMARVAHSMVKYQTDYRPYYGVR